MRRAFWSVDESIYVECGHPKARRQNTYIVRVVRDQHRLTHTRLPPTIAEAVAGRWYGNQWPIVYGLGGQWDKAANIVVYPDGSAIQIHPAKGGWQCSSTPLNRTPLSVGQPLPKPDRP